MTFAAFSKGELPINNGRENYSVFDPIPSFFANQKDSSINSRFYDTRIYPQKYVSSENDTGESALLGNRAAGLEIDLLNRDPRRAAAQGDAKLNHQTPGAFSMGQNTTFFFYDIYSNNAL